MHAKLLREGFTVNVKVVERIYREERLEPNAWPASRLRSDRLRVDGYEF